MTCFGLLIVFQCATAAPPPQIDAARFCKVAKPFEWSSRDTPESQRQAKAWNAAGVKICGWKPPRKVKK